jgi:hypothetical protein
LQQRLQRLAIDSDQAIAEIDSPEVAAAQSAEWPPLRALAPRRPEPSGLTAVLSSLQPQHLVPNLQSLGEAVSLKAGLYLIHDFLHEAHELAQVAEKRGAPLTAAYWHGLVHRREPDYDNARYWFRRVGRHPLFQRLGSDVRLDRASGWGLDCRDGRVATDIEMPLDRAGQWSPMAFIDWCESLAEGAHTPPHEATGSRLLAVRIQALEMRRLLEFTVAAAQGVVP